MSLDSLADLGYGVSRTKSPEHEGRIAEQFNSIRIAENRLANRIAAGGYSDEITRREIGALIHEWDSYGRLRGGEHYGPDAVYSHERVMFYGRLLDGSGTYSPEELAFMMRMDPQRRNVAENESGEYNSFVAKYSAKPN